MKLNTFAASVLMACMATAAPLQVKRAGSSYTGGATANDVNNGVCAGLTLIFARGSTEGGNMGSVVGPGLAKGLISQLGASGVAIQGVDYPASIEGNASLGAQGGPEMAKLAEKAKSQCPSTKIVLGGYSQGGLVTHYAVKSGGLSSADVAAVALYGDPEQHAAVGSVPASKVKEFCASGDGVCETGGFDITAAHLSYASNGDDAAGATFLIQASGASGGGSATTVPSTGTTGSDSSASTDAAAAPSAASGGLASLLGGMTGSSASSALPAAGSASTGAGGLSSLLGSGSSGAAAPSLPTTGSTGGISSSSLSSLLSGAGGSSTGSALGSASSGASGLSGLSGFAST